MDLFKTNQTFILPGFAVAALLGVLYVRMTHALRDIYESRSNVQKAQYYEMTTRKAGALNTWNCTDKLVHARKRRILNAAFSDKAIRAAEPYIIRHADRWCQLLLDGAGDVWSAPRDMAEWSNCLVFDILGVSPSLPLLAVQDIENYSQP
ncbi:MAG: hypothetical protein Q9201_007079 [Fulgogasparrea decipioides]